MILIEGRNRKVRTRHPNRSVERKNKLKIKGQVSRSLLKLTFKLEGFCGYYIGVKYYMFESKTLFMYQNATNYLGSDENLLIENL